MWQDRTSGRATANRTRRDPGSPRGPSHVQDRCGLTLALALPCRCLFGLGQERVDVLVGRLAVRGGRPVRAVTGQERVRAVALVVGVATGDRGCEREAGGLVVGTGFALAPVLEERVVLGLPETFERLAGEGFEGCLALARLAGRDVRRCTGACRDELADDHVLLEPDQVVLGAVDGGLGQHPGGLLEGRGGEERARVERGLRDRKSVV